MVVLLIESACRTRLDLIKAIAIKTLTELKNKADDVYKDMNDWLGARFLKEMERFVGRSRSRSQRKSK